MRKINKTNLDTILRTVGELCNLNRMLAFITHLNANYSQFNNEKLSTCGLRTSFVT